MRLAPFRRERVALAQHALDLLHREAEVLGRAGPARRIDARRAVERIDHQSRIVGERRKARGLRGGLRLEAGIGREGGSGLLRLNRLRELNPGHSAFSFKFEEGDRLSLFLGRSPDYRVQEKKRRDPLFDF